MKRASVLSIAGLIFIGYLVINEPFGHTTGSGFTNIFRLWGNQQQEISEKVTSRAVSGAEGKFVDNHETAGRNWSIPNIIRHWTINGDQDENVTEDRIVAGPSREEKKWALFEIFDNILR